MIDAGPRITGWVGLIQLARLACTVVEGGFYIGEGCDWDSVAGHVLPDAEGREARVQGQGLRVQPPRPMRHCGRG